MRWSRLSRPAASAYVSICQHTSAYGDSMRWSLLSRPAASAYVSIHPHTTAYVSVRLQTSAYGDLPRCAEGVSIRQHTSAYVSIRQHTKTCHDARSPGSCKVRSPFRVRRACISICTRALVKQVNWMLGAEEPPSRPGSSAPATHCPPSPSRCGCAASAFVLLYE